MYVASVITTYWVVSISMVYLNKILLSNEQASISARVRFVISMIDFSASHFLNQFFVLLEILSIELPAATLSILLAAPSDT
jgi:hypothetical protein